MSEKEVSLTRDGLAKLERELDHLRSVRRREVAGRIKQALQFGDISENSEYDDAKNEQAFIEGRIHALEKMLRNARVIEDGEGAGDTVSIGSKVKLKDQETGEVFEWTIVSSMEADPQHSRISNESPVGQAIMGAKAGEVVEVKAPAGTLRYEVLEISR